MIDSLDIFLKKYSYKFPKGYPDMNNEQDINILADLLENLNIDLSAKKINEAELKDKTKFGKAIFKVFNRNIPPVEGNYQFSENLKIDPKDKSNFEIIYNVIPAQNVGKGELALYWLFNYKDPNNSSNTLQKQKDINVADFTIDGKNVEVKAYKSLNSKITLGKFKDDKESRTLISDIFGIINITNLGKSSKILSEVNFNAEDLKSSFENLIELKKTLDDPKTKEVLSEFDIFVQLNDKLSKLIYDNDPEKLAKNVLVKLATTKLNTKPGPGQYILNIPPGDTNIEIKKINEDIEKYLSEKTFDEINKNISVSSAEIQFNFSIFK